MSKRKPSRRTLTLENQLVELLHDGLSFSQACRACEIPRKTVTYWRDADPDLDERLRNASTRGVSRLNDDVLQRYQDVIDGENTWTKEQVAAMRDYSSHVRGLSSKRYPRMYGDKGMSVTKHGADGTVTLTWMSNGAAALPATDLPDPLLLEDAAES